MQHIGDAGDISRIQCMLFILEISPEIFHSLQADRFQIIFYVILAAVLLASPWSWWKLVNCLKFQLKFAIDYN